MANQTWFSNNVTTEPTNQSDEDVRQLALIVASIVIGTLGIFGNGLVILICIRYPLQGITNIVVCNQSLIDFLSSCVFLLLYNLPDYRYNLPSTPFVANFVCIVWISKYPLWVLCVSSTVNLVYVTIERYFAVVHPLKHRLYVTPHRAKLCAVIPWVYGLLHELPLALTHKERERGICSSQWHSDALQFAVGIISPLDHYVIPLLIICCLYTHVYYVLRKRSFDNTDTTSSTTSHVRDLKIKQASRNVIKTMSVVSIAYLICWGPNEAIYFYSNMGGDVNFSGNFHYYTVVSAMCNMCVNPIIYTCHWKMFRLKLLKLFGYKKNGQHKCVLATVTASKVNKSVV